MGSFDPPVFKATHSTLTQMVIAFVRYADRHPERLDEDYLTAATDALQEAFPYPRRWQAGLTIRVRAERSASSTRGAVPNRRNRKTHAAHRTKTMRGTPRRRLGSGTEVAHTS